MYLALQVTGQQAAALGADSSKLFDQRGGTVGRGMNNDWVLPDPERFISTQHFVVRFLNGAFHLEDVSTNGVFLNGATERLRDVADSVVLNTGDQLVVGDYLIVASIVADQSEAVVPTPVQNEPPVAAPPPVSADPSPPGQQMLDPLEMLSGKAEPEAPRIPATFDDHAPAVSQHFTPPEAPAPKDHAAIPDDFELTGFSMEGASAPADPPLTPPPQASPEDNPAPTAPPGMPNPFPQTQEPQPTQPPQAAGAVSAAPSVDGELMTVILQGLMEVLRSRAEIKSQFRVPVTTLKPVENNPLKFSVTVDDAMRHLFGSTDPGFMAPDAAIDEAFQDIKAHQLAMLAGMRAAFTQMLDRFDPDRLERQFGGSAKGGSFMNLNAKGRNWDLYREMFAEMTRDSEQKFNRLFGDAFAEAYEQQMRNLLGSRK